MLVFCISQLHVPGLEQANLPAELRMKGGKARLTFAGDEVGTR